MSASDPISYGSVNVGLADSVVLPGNADRLALLISNPTPNDMWIAFGAPAVINNAIRVPSGSAPLMFRASDWPGLLSLDLHAIASVAAGKLTGLSSLLVRIT